MPAGSGFIWSYVDNRHVGGRSATDDWPNRETRWEGARWIQDGSMNRTLEDGRITVRPEAGVMWPTATRSVAP